MAPSSLIPSLTFRARAESHQTYIPPPGHALVITDQLNSPAEFLLHRALAAHVKDIDKSRVVIVSVSRSFAHWKAIASKANLNLAQLSTSGRLTFIDAGPQLALYTLDSSPSDSPENLTPKSSLRPLFGQISSALTHPSPDSTSGEPTHGAQVMLIIDDISTLEWIGYPSTEIIRFYRAAHASCRKNAASLIALCHDHLPGQPSPLLRGLLARSHAHIEISSLESGRSGAVSGEISIHPILDSSIEPIQRRKALQYRLLDSGAIFFERGTGSGVL
ncbi:hypothetical protein BOTBODRAFT_183988 [Botryobasidium botryosum FD-172 SS1]|uniref:Elongator complex protein 5 n=1 Tax=Botryobasidium botryosum (strain FD-172 SS1) TaxID=930990 RepID=A0A067N766_BOTB1|nr:hypothetical protein BOTBODRAFT_183988 [Botryobasidium botryosum FD-172 SS1]